MPPKRSNGIENRPEQGNLDAQMNLALLYYNARGVPRNYPEAAKWFRNAADQDNTSAQTYLGMMNGQWAGNVQKLQRGDPLVPQSS